MQLSSNYNLKLMEGNDLVKRQDFVDNFTTIDAEMFTINSQLNENIRKVNDYTTNSLALHRLGRKLITEKTGNYNNSQAMVWLDGDIIIQAFQLFQGNTIKLVKMNIKTGEEILTNVIDGFHGNGMCYNTVDNFIYLTPAHNNNQTETFKTVLKISKEDLTIIEVIDLSNKTNLECIASIGFDELKKQYVVNHKNSFEVYSLDWTKVNSFSIDYQYEEDRFQTITVFNGKLYQVTSAPETIWVYDLSEGKITSVLNVDKWQDKIYNLGEIEGISFNRDTGDLYVTSQSRYIETFGGSLTQFWFTNLKTNYVSSSKLIRFQQAQEETTVFANSAADCYNPNGQYDKPFPTLSEAMSALSSPHVGSKVLQLLSEFDENLVISNNCSDLVINGAEKGVKSLLMLYATNVYIPSLKITGSSSYKNSAIYMYMSELMTTAINYTPVSGLDNYAIIERSKITLPTDFLNATDISVLLKNSKCYINQKATNRLKYNALLKENENSHFEGIKWSNGSLATSVTRPSDWKSYRKARVIYRFNGLSELTKEVNFDSDNYTIRIDGVYQNDSEEIRVFSGYLKPETSGSNKYIKGTASGYSYIKGVMTPINNSDITVTFDIAFYD